MGLAGLRESCCSAAGSVVNNLEYLLRVQGLLQSQTQTADEAKQAFTVSEAKNGELTKKLKDAEKRVDELQDSVQRFDINFISP